MEDTLNLVDALIIVLIARRKAFVDSSVSTEDYRHLINTTASIQKRINEANDSFGGIISTYVKYAVESTTSQLIPTEEN